MVPLDEMQRITEFVAKKRLEKPIDLPTIQNTAQKVMNHFFSTIQKLFQLFFLKVRSDCQGATAFIRRHTENSVGAEIKKRKKNSFQSSTLFAIEVWYY